MVAGEVKALCAHGSGFASRERRRGGHKTIRNEFRQIDAAAASNDYSRAKHLSEPNRARRTEPREVHCRLGEKIKHSPRVPPHQRHRGGLHSLFPPPALSPCPYLYRPLPAAARLLVSMTLPTRRRPRRRIIDLTRRRAVIVNFESFRAQADKKRDAARGLFYASNECRRRTPSAVHGIVLGDTLSYGDLSRVHPGSTDLVVKARDSCRVIERKVRRGACNFYRFIINNRVLRCDL